MDMGFAVVRKTVKTVAVGSSTAQRGEFLCENPDTSYEFEPKVV